MLKNVLAVFCGFLFAFQTLAADPAAHRKPNIVIFVADDLGYAELGCQGCKDIPTPHIDSLAKEGVRFTNAYVTAPFCSPSRAGLMTGRYQQRFGHEFNPTGKNNLEPAAWMSLAESTLADRLKAARYATTAVGKWHLGSGPKHHPLERGFDEFFGFLHEGHFYVPGPPWHGVTSFLRKKDANGRKVEGNTIWSSHLPSNEPPYDADNPILRGRSPVQEEAFLTDALGREAVAFVEKNKEKPFFLYLAFNAPHSPMQAAVKYMEKFKNIEDVHRRVFASMVANLDDQVGAVLAKLRELNLDEDTLVFFISDNGGPTTELTSSNKPLRAGKGQLFEGGIRLPFIVRWKDHVPAGVVYDKPVISLDIFPTALAAAGATPPDKPLDGVNLLPFLNGAGTPHDVLYWRFGANSALRKGDWKLVRQGVRKGDGPVQLFDLAHDIGETKDLAKEQPEKVKELQAAWDALNKQMVEPAWKAR